MIGDAVFTSILLPVVVPIVARSGTEGVLRRVLAGGLHDRRHLSDQLRGLAPKRVTGWSCPRPSLVIAPLEQLDLRL
jgi:hypothetical protein